jgi:immunity protein Imm1 of predicted polymorphic toxin system
LRHDVTTLADVQAALSKRHDAGINAFWLSHGSKKLPAISILVKGDIAYVHYFPNDDHPGFASVAKLPGPRPHETTIFFVNPNEKVWILNGAVVPFSDALKAAEEFAISETMPRSIQWSEL